MAALGLGELVGVALLGGAAQKPADDIAIVPAALDHFRPGEIAQMIDEHRLELGRMAIGINDRVLQTRADFRS